MSFDVRPSLVIAALVGLVLVALTMQCLAVLVQGSVPHEGWRVGLSAVVVTGVWWLLNSPLEGATVLYVSAGHGLTIGDLLGVPGLVLGAVVLALAVPAPV